MKTTLTVLAATAALALGGCATSQQTGMLAGAVVGGVIGGGIGAGAGAYAAGAAGAVVGAVIGGAIGKHMDKNDQERARLSIESNKSSTWTNSTTNKTYTVEPKDLGNGKSEVKTTVVDEKGASTSETTVVKKKIRE